LQIHNVKTNKNERETRHPYYTHVTVIDIQALSYSHMTLYRLTKYCCCFVIFGLITNTYKMCQSINQSTKLHIAPYKIWRAVINIVKI